MVDVKISGLPAADALTGNELLAGLQGTKSVKVLVSAIRAGMASDSSVVHTTGDETIGGVKTFTANCNWNLSANGRIVYGEPGGDSAGISLFRGPWNTGSARRGDIRQRTGDLLIGVGTNSDNAPPLNFVSFGPAHVRPTSPGVFNLGTSGNAWLNTFTAELTLTGDDAAKARSRASLGAVGLTGNETIAGTKVFSSEVRIQSVAPSFWLDETDGAPASAGVNLVVDGGTFQAQVRQGGFGPYVRRLFNMSLDGSGVSFDAVTQPWADNTHNLGAGGRRWLNLYVVNAPITGSDKTKKKNLRHMTDAEEAAFLEIAELPSVWEWKVGDRIHGGPTVQDARDVMLDHGLDPWAYSCFCHDSWPAKEAVWREWPAQEEVWEEWPAEDAVYDVVPASYDDDGQVLTPEIRIMVSPAVEAGRRLISEAVEAGRELVEPAVEAGESFSFRVGELHAWMLAAMARRDRREREAAELRLASIEQRLAVLETGK